MFPIHDENPTLRRPVVTLSLIGVTLVAWLFIQGAGSERALAASICSFGLIPAEVTGSHSVELVPLGPNLACQVEPGNAWHTAFTSMFMHTGWFHVLGNLWFLWIFGNNVEDSMGRFRFLVFYLCCGLGAVFAQVFIHPTSTLPLVGASGAIGGVMGAYVVLYPRVPVTLLVFLGIVWTVQVPAYMMLGYWFALQVLRALPQLGGVQGGTAFWEHIGGFVAGALLIFAFRDKELVEEHRRILRRLESQRLES